MDDSKTQNKKSSRNDVKPKQKSVNNNDETHIETEINNPTFDLEQVFQELKSYRNAGAVSVNVEVPNYDHTMPMTDESFVSNQITFYLENTYIY